MASAGEAATPGLTEEQARWDAGTRARWADAVIAGALERAQDPALSEETVESTQGFLDELLAAHSSGEEPLSMSQRLDLLEARHRIDTAPRRRLVEQLFAGMGWHVTVPRSSARARSLAASLAADLTGHDKQSLGRLKALDDRLQLLDDAQRRRVGERLRAAEPRAGGRGLTDLPDELLLKIGDHLNPREVADRQGLRSLGGASRGLRQTFGERVDEARLAGLLLKVARLPPLRAEDLSPWIAHVQTLSDKTRPRPASRKFSAHTVVRGEADSFVGATSMRCDGLAVLLEHLDTTRPLHVTCHAISSIADAVESLADPLQRAHMAQRLFAALAETRSPPIELPGRPIAAQHLGHSIEGVAYAEREPGSPVQPTATSDDGTTSSASSISVDDVASSSSGTASEVDWSALPRQVFEQVSRIARGLPELQQAELLPMQAEAAKQMDMYWAMSYPDGAPGGAEAPHLGAQAHEDALRLFDELHKQAVAARGGARRDLAWGMWRAQVATGMRVDDNGVELPAPPRTVERLMDVTQTLPPDRQPPLLAAVAGRIREMQPSAARAGLGRRCLQACADLQPSQRSAALVHALIDMFGSAGGDLGIDEFETATGFLKDMPPGQLQGGDIGTTILDRALNQFEGNDLRRALAAVREMLQDRGPAAVVDAVLPLIRNAITGLSPETCSQELGATLDLLDGLEPGDLAPGVHPATGARVDPRQMRGDLRQILSADLGEAFNLLLGARDELENGAELIDRLDAIAMRLLRPAGPQAQDEHGA